jgi:hypothetical protein
MIGLDLVRKSPARRAHRISIGTDLRTRGIARRLAEQRAVEQAAAIHARWLASRATVGIPDLAHLEAARIAGQAEAEGERLRREIHALALEERLHPEVPAVRPPLRPPLRPPMREPEPTVYIPARAARLAAQRRTTTPPQ